MALHWPSLRSRPYRPGRSRRAQQEEAAALSAQLAAIEARLAVLDEINERLNRLEEIGERVARIEQLEHGGKAVFLGNGRILAKASIGGFPLGFLLEADDRLLMPRFFTVGMHETEVTEFFLQTVQPTDHCLDVGANFGYYTCLMATLAPQGKTIGVEPDRHVFELLRDNIYINCLEPTASSLQAAVAAEPGTLQLHRRLTRSGNTSMARMPDEFTRLLGEPDSEVFEVEALPIDRLLPQFDGRIDMIKIDVEGGEPLAFAGARETIAANPGIKIVIEWSPGQMQAAGFDPAQFTRDLQQLGLTVAAIALGGPQPIDWEALLGCPYLSGILLTVESA